MNPNTSKTRLLALVATSVGLFAASASAVTITYAPIVVHPSRQAVSSTDLANSNNAAFSSLVLSSGSVSNLDGTSASIGVLTDGSAGNDDSSTSAFRPVAGSVLLLTLSGGYDLSSITTMSAAFGPFSYNTTQNYKIEVAQVGSSTFTELVSGLNTSEANNAVSEERYRSVSVTSTFTASEALNVDRIRFTILTAPGGDGKWYREIDVSGTAAAAIPEPSAFAALAGLVGLGFAASRRRITR
jgi:hypothetical protein